MNKKGQITELQSMIGPLIGVALVLAIGFLILAEVDSQAVAIEGADGYSGNATKTTMSAIDDIPTWLPIIVIAVIGGVLLGLVRFFRT